MLWTASIVLLILCLIGFSIQAGWLLISLLLVVAFGRTDRQPAEQSPNGDLVWRVFHNPAIVSPLAILRPQPAHLATHRLRQLGTPIHQSPAIARAVSIAERPIPRRARHLPPTSDTPCRNQMPAANFRRPAPRPAA